MFIQSEVLNRRVVAKGLQRPKTRQDHFEALQKGKKKSNPRIYRLQSVRYGATFLVKRDTENCGNGRQHLAIIRSKHA